MNDHEMFYLQKQNVFSKHPLIDFPFFYFRVLFEVFYRGFTQVVEAEQLGSFLTKIQN